MARWERCLYHCLAPTSADERGRAAAQATVPPSVRPPDQFPLAGTRLNREPHPGVSFDQEPLPHPRRGQDLGRQLGQFQQIPQGLRVLGLLPHEELHARVGDHRSAEAHQLWRGEVSHALRDDVQWAHGLFA